MRGVLRFVRSPRGKLVLNLSAGALAVGISVLAARHFAEVGWPLRHASIPLVAAAGFLFLLSYAFKAYGWQRLFAPNARPRPLTLAASCGAAESSGSESSASPQAKVPIAKTSTTSTWTRRSSIR